MPTPPPLQAVVDRYAKSLQVPKGLLELHDHTKHRPEQRYMTLAPAIVLSTVSAFEGFAEELIAVVGGFRGLSFAQIVRLAHTNTPSLGQLEDSLTSQLGAWGSASWRTGFKLEVFEPPNLASSHNWWGREDLNWAKLLKQAEGWIQVRHALSHGMTRGYLSEVWPGTLKGGAPASTVLREQKGGKHSLSLHTAQNCIRVFRYGGESLTNSAAGKLGLPTPKWNKVPDFPLA
jgi:hypothetical protein